MPINSALFRILNPVLESFDVQSLLANRPGGLPSLLENTRALERGRVETTPGFNQFIQVQRGPGREPVATGSQIIRELGGGQTSQRRVRPLSIRAAEQAVFKNETRNRALMSPFKRIMHRTPSLNETSIRVIEQMRRMGAPENDQIYYLDMLKQFGQEDIAKTLWNKFFAQNIDESDIFK